MDKIEFFLEKLSGLLWGEWMLVLLLGTGLFYTIITGGIQIRAIPRLFRSISDSRKQKKDAAKSGSLTSLQALYTAIASCVGSGNIIGVATALISGGPGALMWMWIAAFFGMATKYAEIVLGIMSREKDDQGNYLGGPMYYIAKAFKTPVLGCVAAVLLFCQNAGGTLIQSNTITSVAAEAFHAPGIITVAILAITMSLIIKGGLKRLASVAQKVVPFMAGFYVLGGFLVVLSNLELLLPTLKVIVSQAFSLQAGAGAAMGLTMREAMRFGVARGLYSNEAGEGSAAVIHSSAEVSHPSEQGIYGIVEVFVDTMIICSTTGFSILISGVSLEGATAAALPAAAFATVFPRFHYLVSISLILFAATSLMSQWYFGHVSLLYLKSKWGATIYRIIFPILIIIGGLSTTDLVWYMQDCMLGLLIIPNIAALFIMSPKVRKTTAEFLSTK